MRRAAGVQDDVKIRPFTVSYSSALMGTETPPAASDTFMLTKCLGETFMQRLMRRSASLRLSRLKSVLYFACVGVSVCLCVRVYAEESEYPCVCVSSGKLAFRLIKNFNPCVL